MEYKTPDLGYGEDRKKFTEEHRDELGVKRYVALSLRDTLVPLVALGAGGAAGWFGLRYPVKWVAPKMTKITDDLVAISKAIKDIPKEERAAKLSELVVDENLHKLLKEHGEDSFGLVFKGRKAFASQEVRDAIMEGLGANTEEVKEWAAPVAGATIGALAGSSVAGTVLGYDKWQKEEMTRVAAKELTREMSELELFKPSDKELVSEVQRLRQMVDEQPKHHPSSPTTQIEGAMLAEGRVEDIDTKQLGG